MKIISDVKSEKSLTDDHLRYFCILNQTYLFRYKNTKMMKFAKFAFSTRQKPLKMIEIQKHWRNLKSTTFRAQCCKLEWRLQVLMYKNNSKTISKTKWKHSNQMKSRKNKFLDLYFLNRMHRIENLIAFNEYHFLIATPWPNFIQQNN